MQNLELLIKELIKLPNETECVEFKHNNFDPNMIASDISALANSATYRGKHQSYMVWGVHNETHEILGTNYNRFSKLIKNQEIGSWLKNTVSKNADFDFYDVEMEGKKLVVLIIQKAIGQPVTSKKEAYIRIGSYTKPLKDYTAMEAQLWDKLRLNNFEKIEAKSDIVMLAPVSVHADYFHQGIGSSMLKMGIEKVKKMGYKGIIVEGNFNFYNKVGFKTWI